MNSGNKKEEGLLITLHYKIYSNMIMLLRNMGQNPEIYKVGSCTSLKTELSNAELPRAGLSKRMSHKPTMQNFPHELDTERMFYVLEC